MKKSLKTGIFLSALLLLTFALIIVCNNLGLSKIKAYFSVLTFSEEFGDRLPLSEKNFDLLNATEKKAYISIINSVEEHPEYIKIPKLTKEEFSDVFFAVKNDNPDILCFTDSCNMVTFLSGSFLQMNYDYDKHTCNKMMNELDIKAEEIISNIDITDEYAAELAIHDYIIKNCVYDESGINISNAYGCLINGTAVCSGYSRATMLLFEKVGIDSMLVAGTGIRSDDEAVSHMWNLVWINNNPYHLDVTWDDPDDANNTVSHMFFNLTTQAISADHKDISLNIECIADQANYFVKEKLLFDSYGSDVLDFIKQELCSNINNGINSIEFCFTDEDPYSRAVKAIIDNSVPRSDMYAIIDYISANASGLVDTSHINFIKDNNKYYIRIMFDSV